jgi:hypothetical protein
MTQDFNPAFTPDSDLLDRLAKAADPQYGGWICRTSTTDRGLRLHQISQHSAAYWNLPVFSTPQEAIAAFLASLPQTGGT